MSDADRHENPLVPNKKLREIYLAMVDARALGDRLPGHKKRQRDLARNEEACRVSTAIDLQPGDLVSDSHDGQEDARQLRWIEDSRERLRLAMGAALSLKKVKPGNLVVAYARSGEIGRGEWRKILKIASRLELPIFFVVLPPGSVAKKKITEKSLAIRMRSCGVPVIMTDAGDAVALYRVTQETFGRIRGGGGPVVVECANFALEGSRRVPPVDPVSQMKDFLLAHGVASQRWLDDAGNRLRRRVKESKLQRD